MIKRVLLTALFALTVFAAVGGAQASAPPPTCLPCQW